MIIIMSGDEKDVHITNNTKAWDRGLVDRRESVAPYVPTPQSLVNTMLEMANAGPGDVVYDLGCGDGRFLITAIRDYNVDKAVGYEITPQLAKMARDNVAENDYTTKITIENTDFMEADFSEATLITLYLTTSGNAQLRPKFRKELKEGARVISHDFPITGWVTANEDNEPIKVDTHKVYYYTIPDAYTRNPEQEQEESGARWGRIKKLFERL
jgi:SAM-dependent methyltransferase